MRLLILTQAVDLDDPVLGFFHQWIEELARHCERVHVICLKEGRHTLPPNTSVYSLGKESGPSRMKYVWRFYRHLWLLRKAYDAVFVHMNQEYVLLGGLWWRVKGKRVVLWRNHQKGSAWTRIAARFANTVCYTSPEAYVRSYKNAQRMPVGIDTKMFRPSQNVPRADSILFFGRLDPVKRPEIFVAALEKLREMSVAFVADIVGDPTYPDSGFEHELRNKAAPLIRDEVLAMKRSVAHRESPVLFESHAIYVNLTPSGSFDKTIGEAAACGCTVVAANEVLRGIIPEPLLVDPSSTDSVAAGIQTALKLTSEERRVLGQTLRAWVLREHSLPLLAQKLERLFSH